VDCHTGKMHAPRGQMITMVKSSAVWQIPVMSPPKHTVLAATTTAPTNVAPSLDNMWDVEHMHEVLCCAGTTSMLRYYDHYHGTGFGKAHKADVRKFRCPIKALMQGPDTQKKRRLQTSNSGTKEVHAHAAHLHDEDVSCACCADQQPTSKDDDPSFIVLNKRRIIIFACRLLVCTTRTRNVLVAPTQEHMHTTPSES
jgi:hypothetical protein